MSDVDNVEAMHVLGYEMYVKTLYHPLNFVLNVKML